MLPGLVGASPAQEQVSGISGGGGCSATHSQLPVVKPQEELPLMGLLSYPVTGGTLSRIPSQSPSRSAVAVADHLSGPRGRLLAVSGSRRCAVSSIQKNLLGQYPGLQWTDRAGLIHRIIQGEACCPPSGVGFAPLPGGTL